MFKAAYKTDFYRAVRDALHAEVDSWHESESSGSSSVRVDALWRTVHELEPVSRDADAFISSESIDAFTSGAFVPVAHLTSAREF